MPVMSEQVHKARAERLLQLRFEERMRPTAAWRVVSPNSKAADSSAVERTRSEIRRYRERYCVVDAPGESDGLEGGEAGGPNGSALNGAAAEVAEDVAAKPAKRCAGVAGRPCGKEIGSRTKTSPPSRSGATSTSPRSCARAAGRRQQRERRPNHHRTGAEGHAARERVDRPSSSASRGVRIRILMASRSPGATCRMAYRSPRRNFIRTYSWPFGIGWPQSSQSGRSRS